MDIYSTWEGVGEKHKDIVVGLGNFDGIHVGHQRLIAGLVGEAEKIGGTPAVFTFYPHPLEVLVGKAPPRLLSQKAKQETFRHMGVRLLLQAPFTLEFASRTPEAFIEKVLVKDLKIRSVYVGYNYTFGQGGRGNPETLIDGGRRYGFNVYIIPPVTVDGVPVSSTLIRGLLADGEVYEARKYLGYYTFIEGDVVAGDSRGRSLGFPTANLNLEEGLTVPANGVYAVKVQVDGEHYLGVANIGIKPTFKGFGAVPNLEVHLLDFHSDLYGKRLKVFFTRRIREEKRFSSPGELVEQIRMDISRARDAQTD
ncbi:MAG: riboflavin biosynthesis protein RibF [Peptococcaceae bacterium BICA1-7]|nr:MAG: riboflavin biosynthesis protein RibF [Peptococcaceae bacterium BICA1-7]HBV98847.1 bifunctional riboflavin kinase/FAD synthetase [Desulfotomaculum sp.]